MARLRRLGSTNVNELEMQSKKGESLCRYFPRDDGAASVQSKKFVVDGRIVMPATKFLVDDLLQRILRAASRIKSSPPNTHPFDRFPPAYQCRRQIQNCLPLRQRRRLFEAGAFLAAATACFCSDDLDSPGSIDKLHWPSAFPSDLASARACSSMAAVYDGRRSEVYNRSDERSKPY
jgi:hypothetical protein